MKILLLPLSSGRNIGDIAKEQSAIRLLKTAFPKCYLSCLTYYAKEDVMLRSALFHTTYDEGCDVLPSLLPLVRLGSSARDSRDTASSLLRFVLSVVRGFIFLFCCMLLKTKAVLLLSHELDKKAFRALISADLVVHIGSDRFLSLGSGFKGFVNALVCSYELMLSKIYSRRVVILGASLGPFSGISKWVMGKTLEAVSKIYVREVNSKNFLIEAGVDPSRVTVIPDLGFAFSGTSYEDFAMDPITQKYKSGVIITSPLPAALNWMKNPSEYLLCIARLCDYIAETKNAHIYLVPFTISVPNDDVIGLLEVRKLMKRKNSATVLPYNSSPFYWRAFLRSMDLVVSSRVHGVILGSNMAIAIPVVHKHRLTGVMEMLGLQEFCYVSEGALDIEKIKPVVDEAWGIRRKRRLEQQNRRKSLLIEFKDITNALESIAEVQ